MRVSAHFPWATLPHVAWKKPPFFLVEVKFVSEGAHRSHRLASLAAQNRGLGTRAWVQEGGIGTCPTGGHVSSATTVAPTDPCATSSGGTKGGGASKTGSSSSANPATAASCGRAAAGNRHRRRGLRHRRCPPCASSGTWQLRVWASARARAQTRHPDGHRVHSELAHGPGAVLQLKPTPCHPLVLRQATHRLVQDEHLVSRLGIMLNYTRSPLPVALKPRLLSENQRTKTPTLS